MTLEQQSLNFKLFGIYNFNFEKENTISLQPQTPKPLKAQRLLPNTITTQAAETKMLLFLARI